MKRPALMLFTAALGIGSLIAAQAPAQPELRPSQVAMRARAAWMKSMTENLAAKQFAEVAKSADELSAQASKGAASATGEPQLLHQKVASLAQEVSAAAQKSDELLVKTKLSAITETCTECHTKYRPKP